MLESLEEIISIAAGGAAILSAAACWVVSLFKNRKNKKLIKTAETANEITLLATEKIAEVEKLFSEAASVLKAVGVKTGEIKKESVMTYIEGKCLERGVKFDFEYWSDKVEKLVGLLNATKEAL